MDDKLFLACLIYVLVSSLIVGFMPSTMLVGVSAPHVPSVFVVLLFVFVPWALVGVPLLVASFIGILNYFCFTVGAIWVYDKIRGI